MCLCNVFVVTDDMCNSLEVLMFGFKAHTRQMDKWSLCHQQSVVMVRKVHLGCLLVWEKHEIEKAFNSIIFSSRYGDQDLLIVGAIIMSPSYLSNRHTSHASQLAICHPMISISQMHSQPDVHYSSGRAQIVVFVWMICRSCHSGSHQSRHLAEPQ